MYLPHNRMAQEGHKYAQTIVFKGHRPLFILEGLSSKLGNKSLRSCGCIPESSVWPVCPV